MKLLFLDTETTGLGEDDRICQVAFSVRGEDEVRSSYFRPPVAITPDASAVSHITNKMVEHCQTFPGSYMYRDLTELLQTHVLVAHNAAFDIRMLGYDGIDVPRHICTQKVAKAIGGPSKFSLQYLRYLLDLDVDGVAHTADGDVKVLIALFHRLEEEMTVDEMLLVS